MSLKVEEPEFEPGFLKSSESMVLLFHGVQCGCSISGWVGGPASRVSVNKDTQTDCCVLCPGGRIGGGVCVVFQNTRVCELGFIPLDVPLHHWRTVF